MSEERTAYELGFDLGWEGSPIPSLPGLAALGLDELGASEFILGWRAGVDVARLMIEEATQ